MLPLLIVNCECSRKHTGISTDTHTVNWNPTDTTTGISTDKDCVLYASRKHINNAIGTSTGTSTD